MLVVMIRRLGEFAVNEGVLDFLFVHQLGREYGNRLLLTFHHRFAPRFS